VSGTWRIGTSGSVLISYLMPFAHYGRSIGLCVILVFQVNENANSVFII
jgi:hypothetical protein